MPNHDKRVRSKGRKGFSRNERYALVPEDVMQSAAFHALPDWAKSVLFALAARFNGHNNGNLCLTFKDAKSLGTTAQWKPYAGLKVICLTGLIECTRRGRLDRGKKLPSLYAVAWRGIDPCEGITFDYSISAKVLPRSEWARWEKPQDWQNTIKKIKNDNHGSSSKKFQTQPRGVIDHSTTQGVTRNETAHPCGVIDKALTAPPMVVTSKNLGDVNGNSQHHAS